MIARGEEYFNPGSPFAELDIYMNQRYNYTLQ
jgi:hypothetical protein